LVERLRRRAARQPLRAVEALAASLSGEIEIDGEMVEFESGGSIAGLAERLREVGVVNHDLESFSGSPGHAPPVEMADAVIALAAMDGASGSVRVSANRAVARRGQLRLGEDGRWYLFGRPSTAGTYPPHRLTTRGAARG